MVLLLSRQEWRQTCIVGVDCREGPPVPIPNTEVKLAGAEDTWLETARKNRFSPTQKNHLCKQVVFLWLHHRQVAGRSLSLASPGVKRWLSVRGGCGGCATGKSRGARCHSLYPEWNANCLSAVAAVAAVAAPRASRGALVATRFTRNETPALCPRWLVGYDG